MALFGTRKGGSEVVDSPAPALDTLKQKYQPVLNLMQRHGVRLQNVHVENGKLLIRGEAPSEQVKNQVWDQIKLVNPGWSSELVADISVRPGGSEQKGGDGGGRTYTVRSGDTLSRISQQFYGDANQYRKIFDANRDKLNDPDKIQPGQVLTIP